LCEIVLVVSVCGVQQPANATLVQKIRSSMFIKNLLDYIVMVRGKVVHISAMKASGGVEIYLHS
jgi:hypothetical protein